MTLGLVVMLLGGGAACYYYLYHLKKHPKAAAAKRSGKDLEVLNYALQKAKDGDLVYVVGVLTNYAPIQYFDLRVEFDLLDKDGKKVGDTHDLFKNLGPTAAWNFKAVVVLAENAAEAKLTKVMGEPDTAPAGGGTAKKEK